MPGPQKSKVRALSSGQGGEHMYGQDASLEKTCLGCGKGDQAEVAGQGIPCAGNGPTQEP